MAAIMRIKIKKGNQGYFHCAEKLRLVDKNFSLCICVSRESASEIPGVMVLSLGGQSALVYIMYWHVSELSEPIWKIVDERL